MAEHQLESVNHTLIPRPPMDLTPEVTSLTNKVIDLVPDEVIKRWTEDNTLSPEQYQAQALDLAKYSAEVTQIEDNPFAIAQIGEIPTRPGKLIAVRERLRETLARVVVNSPRTPERNKHAWGVKMREITDYSGPGYLLAAINSLPEVERALVLKVSSVSLLTDLGYVDLDQCDPKRFATYLRDVAFDPKEQRDDAYTMLIGAAIERSDQGNLDLRLIVDWLCRPPYNGKVLDELLASARVADFGDELIELFNSHPATQARARKLRRILTEGEDYLDAGYPRNRPVDNPFQQPRRRREED